MPKETRKILRFSTSLSYSSLQTNRVDISLLKRGFISNVLTVGEKSRYNTRNEGRMLEAQASNKRRTRYWVISHGTDFISTFRHRVPGPRGQDAKGSA